MSERYVDDSIESIGTMAAAIDFAAAIVDELVGNGISGQVKAGNIESTLSGAETISLVATRINTQTIAQVGISPQIA